MQKHSQLSRHCGQRPLARAFALTGEFEAAAAQIGIGPEGPENIVCRLNQRAAEQFIAIFSDAEFGRARPGLLLSRFETQVTPYVPTALKSVGIADNKYERHGRQRANAGHLFQPSSRFRIARERHVLNLRVITGDRVGQAVDLRQDRSQRRPQPHPVCEAHF